MALSARAACDVIAQFDTAGSWARRRLLGALVAVITMGVAVLVGLLLAVYFAIAGTTSEGHDGARPTGAERPASATATGRAHRDAVAAQQMPAVDAAAAQPAPPGAVAAPAMTVPASLMQGPAGVPSGFPHTPQGAIGQLASIEQVVLQSMSMRETAAVHADWALPGAPGVARWPLAQDVRSFLGSAQMGSALDPTSTVVVTRGSPGQRHRWPGLGAGVRARHSARHHYPGRADGLRLLRTHAVAR